MTPSRGLLQEYWLGVAWVVEQDERQLCHHPDGPHLTVSCSFPADFPGAYVSLCAGPYRSHFTDKKTKTQESSWEAL